MVSEDLCFDLLRDWELGPCRRRNALRHLSSVLRICVLRSLSWRLAKTLRGKQQQKASTSALSPEAAVFDSFTSRGRKKVSGEGEEVPEEDEECFDRDWESIPFPICHLRDDVPPFYFQVVVGKLSVCLGDITLC